jgi:hypothetical protein
VTDFAVSVQNEKLVRGNYDAEHGWRGAHSCLNVNVHPPCELT